jgi:hypothetical protein
MSFVFWVPFGVGTVYSLRKEVKKPVPWGLPISALTTTTIMHTLRSYKDVDTLSVAHVKDMPKRFGAAAVWQGSIFCLGHLFTKMTYPLVKYD